MLDDFSLQALVAYAEAHPLIATLLLLVAVVLLGSLLRKVFKVAVGVRDCLVGRPVLYPRGRRSVVGTGRRDRQRGRGVG